METENKIFYGMGKDYLPTWGIREALREIYQNFLDYGEFSEETTADGELTSISIRNDWRPDSLDWLRIGNTQKNNPNAIGKHGEGVKMAFLILARLGYECEIVSDKYSITPAFYTDKEAGECFCMSYNYHVKPEQKFTVSFMLPTSEYKQFKDSVIRKEDILFSHSYYGDVVNKPAGSIYSGGLFVVNLPNIGKAYNIKPEHMPLDRDRSVPRAFDVNWNTSKINEAYKKWEVKDLSHSDTEFIEEIPEEIKSKFEPRIVGKNIEFIAFDENNNEKIIGNPRIQSALKRDNFFQEQIKKLKLFLIKKIGLYDLLLEFREKHISDMNSEALTDFNMILERVATPNNEEL
jgi:hypothetical protein